jgi:hypothetical protein
MEGRLTLEPIEVIANPANKQNLVVLASSPIHPKLFTQPLFKEALEGTETNLWIVSQPYEGLSIPQVSGEGEGDGGYNFLGLAQATGRAVLSLGLPTKFPGAKNLLFAESSMTTVVRASATGQYGFPSINPAMYAGYFLSVPFIEQGIKTQFTQSSLAANVSALTPGLANVGFRLAGKVHKLMGKNPIVNAQDVDTSMLPRRDLMKFLMNTEDPKDIPMTGAPESMTLEGLLKDFSGMKFNQNPNTHMYISSPAFYTPKNVQSLMNTYGIQYITTSQGALFEHYYHRGSQSRMQFIQAIRQFVLSGRK